VIEIQQITLKEIEMPSRFISTIRFGPKFAHHVNGHPSSKLGLINLTPIQNFLS